MSVCATPECGRPSAKGGQLCWACRRQGDVPARGARYGDAWARLTEAALGYADADSEDEEAWAKAVDRLRKAAQAYARGLVVRAAVRARRRPRHSRPGQLALFM